MGWASGSELLEKCVRIVHKNVKNASTRINIYGDMIKAFEEQDCDTVEECRGIDAAFDVALVNCGYDNDDDR